MKVVFKVIILFMLLYSFKIPLIYNSIFFAFVLSIFFASDGCLSELTMFLKVKNNFVYVFVFSLPFIYYLSLTTFTNEYDYTLINIFIGSLLYYALTIFIVCAVFSKSSLDEFNNILIIVIALQAAIILFSFSFPAFQQLLDIFRTNESIEISQRYYGGGIRGLALSGSQFFGLSSLLAVIVFVSAILEYESKKRVWVYLMLIICSIVFMSVGRTAIIGIIFFQLYAILSLKQFVKYSLTLLAILPATIFAVLSALSNVDASISQKINNFTSFAFEMFYNYMGGDNLSTSSTDKLDAMYYVLNTKTFLFGDGLYTNIDGSYYGLTDAGYMRHALAFGVPMSIFMFVATYVLLKHTFINYKAKRICFFMALLALLHYKGEVFGTLIGMNVFIFFMYCFCIVNKLDKHSLCKPID